MILRECGHSCILPKLCYLQISPDLDSTHSPQIRSLAKALWSILWSQKKQDSVLALDSRCLQSQIL